MDLIPIKIVNGEEKAWGLVCGLPREEVCRNTGAGFDEKAGAYLLRSYGRYFHVNPDAQNGDGFIFGRDRKCI